MCKTTIYGLAGFVLGEADTSRESICLPKSALTIQNNANWKARFLLELVGAVKIIRLQWHFANFANRVIFGR